MRVAIVMGSISDRPIVEKAYDLLREFGVDVTMRVMSAHRTPEAAATFSAAAADEGIDVIIAAAGKAAHLAGVLAAGTTLPVIGLPLSASQLDGMDALLSTVQMPKGVPVATVAINGAENAALLAVQMLALREKSLREAFRAYKEKMRADIEETDAALQEALGEGR